MLLTSTLNVPRVADALITYMFGLDPEIGRRETVNPLVLECFGAGVGMRCQGFKSGIGTASRLLDGPGYRLGVLAVPNFGFPGDLVVAGAPVGRELAAVAQPSERGSCVFVMATDAPLSALDLRRLAWRCFLGMAFTTNPQQERPERSTVNLFFCAAVEASEEAILDALFAAETTTGRDGHTMPALPIPETLEISRQHQTPGLRARARR